MTMRIVAKFYPITEDDVVKAKEILEQFKRDVLAPRGAYVGGLWVSEGREGEYATVSFDNYVHLDK